MHILLGMENPSVSLSDLFAQIEFQQTRQYANRSEHAIANSKYTGLLGSERFAFGGEMCFCEFDVRGQL